MGAMFKGEVAFWKCFLIFLAVLILDPILLKVNVHINKPVASSDPRFLHYLHVLGFFLLFAGILHIWTSVSLYQCSYNAQLFASRIFGKVLGFLDCILAIYLFGLGIIYSMQGMVGLYLCGMFCISFFLYFILYVVCGN